MIAIFNYESSFSVNLISEFFMTITLVFTIFGKI
jgi:glycerol uptake facilitator-like aquaporin